MAHSSGFIREIEGFPGFHTDGPKLWISYEDKQRDKLIWVVVPTSAAPEIGNIVNVTTDHTGHIQSLTIDGEPMLEAES